MKTYQLALETLSAMYPHASPYVVQAAAMARVSNYLPAHNVTRLPAERMLPPEAWRKVGAI